MAKNSHTHAKYWAEYDGLQHVKHQLLHKYLGAWYPILSSWSGRVLYVDCNAGRGRHDTGDEGSPILALKSLLNHSMRNRILNSTEVNFLFFENNAENYRHLMNEINLLGNLPQNIKVTGYEEDYENELQRVVQNIRFERKKLAPAFFFVDPFGFQISMKLLNDLLSFGQSELFINFMYRYVDLSMQIPSQEENMDNLFGGGEWRKIAQIDDYKKRAEETLDYFANQLKAKYVTKMTMLANNSTIKYVLFHATNHSLGREKMKDAMWAINPDGNFYASERHDPNQLILIQPKPNLKNLRKKLLREFSGQSIQVKKLYEWLEMELYRKPHLHTILSELREENLVKFNGDYKKVPFIKNPNISFPSHKQERLC